MSFTHETTVLHDGEELKVKLYYDYLPAQTNYLGQVQRRASYDIYRVDVKRDKWEKAPDLLHDLDQAALVADIKAGLGKKVKQ